MNSTIQDTTPRCYLQPGDYTGYDVPVVFKNCSYQGTNLSKTVTSRLTEVNSVDFSSAETCEGVTPVHVDSASATYGSTSTFEVTNLVFTPI